MTDIYFNGGDGKIKAKTLTIYAVGEDLYWFEIETESGYKFQSPHFKAMH